MDEQPTRPRERDTPWSIDAGYLYSRHQLLGLDVAMSFVADLTARREGDRTIWHLEADDRPKAPTIEALGTWRSLAIALSGLDTYYWPFMTHTVHFDLGSGAQYVSLSILGRCSPGWGYPPSRSPPR